MSDLTAEQEAERDAALEAVRLRLVEAYARDVLDETIAFKAIRTAYMKGYMAGLQKRADE